MTALGLILVSIPVVLLLYAFIGYPAIMWVLATLRDHRLPCADQVADAQDVLRRRRAADGRGAGQVMDVAARLQAGCKREQQTSYKEGQELYKATVPESNPTFNRRPGLPYIQRRAARGEQLAPRLRLHLRPARSR